VEYISGSLEQKVYSNLISSKDLKWTFDYDGSPTTNVAKIHYTVTGSTDSEVTLPGASGISSDLLRVRLTITTAAGSKRTTLSVANMGK